MRDQPPAYPLIIYDDREWVAERLNRHTGVRRYGSLHVRGRSMTTHFAEALPDWGRERLSVVEPGASLDQVWSRVRALQGGEGVLIVAARGAVADAGAVRQILMRMPYAKQGVVERRRHALLRYFPSVDTFRDRWDDFQAAPLHLSPDVDDVSALLAGPNPLLDIGELPALLNFIAGATAARAFNQLTFDDLTYRKRSADKAKMRGEHDYYGLIPQSMRPWMAGAFDYREDAGGAEYKMLRYGFADAAFQWVHNAWSASDYSAFLSRIMHFLANRPRRAATRKDVEAMAHALFVRKVTERRARLEADPVGRLALASLANSPGGQRVVDTFDEYLALVAAHWSRFSGDAMVIGHGDPCLSNILFDPMTATLKLIDPAGATSETDLWTHPLYDYCKLSHSIAGDYDFINNMLFQVSLNERGEHSVVLRRTAPVQYKQQFERSVSDVLDLGTVRLGEASLFLSMLPLHVDRPSKVVALLLQARAVLDQAKAAL
jgi:hypothetical protein